MYVGGDALSGPGREGSECCGNTLWGRECLKGSEGQVPNLKAPGENTWACRVAVLCPTAGLREQRAGL